MGVEANTYVLFGVKLPFEDYRSDEWYDKMTPYRDSAFKKVDNSLPLNIVDDGMNGDYVFVGKVLARTDIYGDIEPTEISVPNKQEIEEKIEELLGIKTSDSEYKLWVFTHHR